MTQKGLYDQLVSEENIYKAIYSLESYLFEKELLTNKDIELYKDLSDKYNTTKIKSVISRCQRKLKNILSTNELFKIKVFFKPKKINNEGEEDYRPMHTSDLITQISLVSMLNLIMFDDLDGTRKLSDICKLIPSNFYGNIPSTNVDSIFKQWQKQYSEYSKDIITANKEYSENEKYVYEINLDLKRFFPSIDPIYIYNFIWEKISDSYDSTDSKTLKVILKKLLFFEIDFQGSKNDINFYYKELDEKNRLEIIKQEKYFNIGIPQGLPQSYLFGNFCMIEISKNISITFDGDAYYYVDDSVIFTNFNENGFKDAVKDLNERLKKIKGKHNRLILPSSLKQFNHHVSGLYNIQIHTAVSGSKTKIYDISSSNYLFDIIRPASTISFEIKASFDDLEDETLRRKIEAILKSIELKAIEFKSSENQELLILLNRYKKFYLYRLKILDYRRNNQVSDEEVDNFADNFGIEPFNKAKFFTKLEDDIFIREAQMFMKFLIDDEKQQKSIIYKVENFEKNLDNEFTNNYFSKVLRQSLKFLFPENIIYKSLEQYSKKTVPPYLKVNLNERNEKIKEYIRTSNPINNGIYKNGFFKFISDNSPEFNRKLYNALFSYILNVPINDNCNLIKTDNRAILYYELRILTYLRLNFCFELNYFQQFAQSVFKEVSNNEEKVDLSLFEVIPHFKRFISEPHQIDDLILTHKFVTGIWKNGSKFLHFYTLHNEEHSIELIKYCTKITKSIDYLSVKKFDYYILFLACYLHDVSMVLYPNLDDFNRKGNLDSEMILTKWRNDFNKEIEDIDSASSTAVSKFILNSFNIINTYFENNIRSNHPKSSARFIKNQFDLYFIERLTRKLVADISEGHGYDTKDIYGLKSNARNDTISEKYLMIILRLADLLDMSKDRVSINVLKQNINHMPKESKFQWISHMAVDKCTIETEFVTTDSKRDKNIEENVIIRIRLNDKQMTSIKNDNPCRNLNCNVLDKNTIEVIINPENESTCTGNCNFTSKWMIKKHNYLFKELQSLQNYLNRNSSNTVFKTSFKVFFEIKNTNKLSPEFMDIISFNIS